MTLEQEYERRRRHRQAILVEDLDDETLEAIRTAKPSDQSKSLDHLMDESKAG